ncbi:MULTISPECIES: AAA family ATPase [unclassified Caballeronia]|uniref:AAA family ATPase n=1 Tax=unclassified Caballeronia TaxID=2646786 RepID=UPI00285C0367|nr:MULTISPECIES: AAA family ATPase [unclassified Caballeronia]MDR5777708.1 AAA family ATPase [Caballeronia sp. LZ002]MDR5853148.1 AAA family ATPase [Caballeronia sp. LZ003]
MSDLVNVEAVFADALTGAGFSAPEIIADSTIHRFAGPEDKRGKKSAWYVLHSSRFGLGAFGDWKTGHKENWSGRAESTLTAEERAQWKREQQEIRAAVEHEAKARRAEAAAKAKRIWAKTRDATDDNPYCVAKGIKPYGLKEFKDKRTLIVPVRDASGELVSVQFIHADGTKRFLTGGAKRGCYYSFGPKPADRIIIAEGFATAASLFEATGLSVAVAFDSGNLKPVALAVKANLPTGCKIIVAADDDAETAGNPGITAATDAAKSVTGLLAVPDFGDNRPEGASDFNDLAQHAGLAAVVSCLAATTRPGGTDKLALPKQPGRASVLLTRASDIVPEAIRWLWRSWIPDGKFTLLAGSPGTGKTTVALALAATVTRGGMWPDGTACGRQGDVLIWSGEDGQADTLVPRLMAAGADLECIHFVSGLTNQHGEIQPFDPARDAHLLNERLATLGNVAMLIVDPVMSAVAGDANKANDVRRDLQVLVDIAHTHRCTVLGISHFRKGSAGSVVSERVLGSGAFNALARMTLVAAKDEAQERRILARAKCNVGRDDGGISYTLEQIDLNGIEASRVAWGEQLDGTARDILDDVEQADNAERSERDEAIDFLRDLLCDGPVPVKSIKHDASGAGYAWRTIERAKRELSVEARKISMKDGWVWALPAEVRHEKSEVRQTKYGGGLREGWRSSVDSGVSGELLNPKKHEDREDRHGTLSGGLRKASGGLRDSEVETGESDR